MSRSIRPGEFRHLITIQKNTTGRDAIGGISNSWSTHVTAWASIKPLQGFEAESGDKVRGRIRYLFTLLWQSGIHPQMRISWDSRFFDIESVLEQDEGNALIMMNATETDDQS